MCSASPLLVNCLSPCSCFTSSTFVRLCMYLCNKAGKIEAASAALMPSMCAHTPDAVRCVGLKAAVKL